MKKNLKRDLEKRINICKMKDDCLWYLLLVNKIDIYLKFVVRKTSCHDSQADTILPFSGNIRDYHRTLIS